MINLRSHKFQCLETHLWAIAVKFIFFLFTIEGRQLVVIDETWKRKIIKQEVFEFIFFCNRIDGSDVCKQAMGLFVNTILHKNDLFNGQSLREKSTKFHSRQTQFDISYS